MTESKRQTITRDNPLIPNTKITYYSDIFALLERTGAVNIKIRLKEGATLIDVSDGVLHCDTSKRVQPIESTNELIMQQVQQMAEQITSAHVRNAFKDKVIEPSRVEHTTITKPDPCV